MDQQLRHTKTPNCIEHTEEEIRFYCDDCGVFICDDCISGSGAHSKCTKTKLIEYGNTHRQSLLDYAQNIADTRIPTIEKVLADVEQNRVSFNKSIDNNIRSVQSKREVLRVIFDEMQEDLIKQFNDAGIAANETFNEFKGQLERKRTRLKEITNVIQSEGHNVDAKEIAIYASQLAEILNNSLASETIPKIEQPKHNFDEDFVKKNNLRHIIGYLDYGNYEQLHLGNSLQTLNKATTSADLEKSIQVEMECITISSEADVLTENSTNFHAVNKRERNYFQAKRFNLNKNAVLHIVPTRQSTKAWIIGKEIGELDFSTEKTMYTCLLPSLEERPVAAARSKEKGLLLSLNNSKSIQQLYSSETLIGKTKNKFSSYIHVPSQQLKAMCTAFDGNRDILILIECPPTGSYKEKPTILRWYSSAKMNIKEISLFPSNVEIENPIHISENSKGDICITCAPTDTSSWVLLLDKSGNQTMRYPLRNATQTDSAITNCFIAAEFLTDGTITILDRAQAKQHLITANGEVIQIDSYDNKPSCFAVDKFDFVWVGFDDGNIQWMQYDNGYYEVIRKEGP